VGRISVEVVFALPGRQVLADLELPDGATVADAIAASGVIQQFPEVSLATLATGVWGQQVEREHVLAAGDRVEIYRPLQSDPREARRQQAKAGKTMRGSGNTQDR